MLGKLFSIIIILILSAGLVNSADWIHHFSIIGLPAVIL